MCGRYAITTPLEAMERLFNFEGQLVNFPARYNVAPTQDVPIVRIEEGRRRLAMVRWGLVPHWSRDMPKDKPLINARSETVAEKPSFREAFRRQRCLVLADGFYEWKRTDSQRFAFYASPFDGNMFAMAGVWDIWRAPTGEDVESVAIVTTAATGRTSEIHHRMPLVVTPSDYDEWLNCEGAPPLHLLEAAPQDFFDITPVSSLVNRIANDGPELLNRADHADISPPPAKTTDQLSLF